LKYTLYKDKRNTEKTSS